MGKAHSVPHTDRQKGIEREIKEKVKRKRERKRERTEKQNYIALFNLLIERHYIS